MTPNTISKKLGVLLLKQGEQFLRQAFKIKPQVISSSGLKDLIKDKTDLTNFSFAQIYTADDKYNLEDWETWKSLIKWDWTEQRKYVSDIYDCDNFSGSFQAHMAEIFLLNSVGWISCRVWDKDTGRFVAYHRANIIPTKDGKVYLFEAQNDGFTELIKGRQAIINNWRYGEFSQCQFN